MVSRRSRSPRSEERTCEKSVYVWLDSPRWNLSEVCQLPHLFELSLFSCPIISIYLIGPTESLERAMQLIKGGSSRRAALQFETTKTIWERGFTDHRIRDAADYDRQGCTFGKILEMLVCAWKWHGILTVQLLPGMIRTPSLSAYKARSS
jgi:hypothetical protein